MGLKDFMNKCGARLQKPGAQRKRGSVKDILEALSCYNSGSAQASPSQMRSITHSIQTGQTGLDECCPSTGLQNHTKVVLFYDLTSMGAGELADAFIASNKFFNEKQQQNGFFGDVYHIGAYGERWVSWPAWVLNRNVHTRGFEDHVNGPHTGTDALDELLAWISADGGGTLTGTVNGAITFDGSGDPNETTVYYGTNQTSPTMPPVFSNTEELLVVCFEDEAHVTPNRWIDIHAYVDNGAGLGPDGDHFIGGYYDGPSPHPTVATDGSYVSTWMDVAASHTLQVNNIPQLGGAATLKINPGNVAHKPDHSGDSDNHVYDPTFWTTLGLSGVVVTTNTCDSKIQSNNYYNWNSHWDYMSANHHNTDCTTVVYEMSDVPYSSPPYTCDPGPNGGPEGYFAYYTCQDVTGVTINWSTTLDDLITFMQSDGCAACVNGMTFMQLRGVWKSHLGGVASNNAAAYINSGFNTCTCTSTAGGPDGCVLDPPATAAELNYTYSYPSAVGALTGSMDKYRQTTTVIPDAGTPTVLFQHDYCVAKKVINAHLGNIRTFVYSVPPVVGSRVKPHVVFPLHVIGAMENGPLATAPTGSYCDLTNATTVGPYDSSGFNNMMAFGAGMGYNITDLPCSSAQFSIDIEAYLNL